MKVKKPVCNYQCLCYACTKYHCTAKISCHKRCIDRGIRDPIIHCENFEHFRLVHRYKIRRVKHTDRSIDIIYFNFQFPSGGILYHRTYHQIQNLKRFYHDGKVTLYAFDDRD